MKACQFIGVVGGSGSGKSWLARKLQECLGDACGHLCLDDFYQDLSHLDEAERCQVNFDDPQAIDWNSLGEVLAALENGESAQVPVYDFTTHSRHETSRELPACEWLVVEGLWLLHHEWLREKLLMSVFVDCPEEERLRRRIERDVLERGRSEESVRKQFGEHVQPMHALFVEPQRTHAMHRMASPMTHAQCEALVREMKGS
ncbi:MAG: uridine kinase [Akkermansiaceae bacterium]|jgi:uridine kinase|nr:uridine kinase [Akkermansiaceae bacterium]